MNINEYMECLEEQIHNKRAKKLVTREIKNHILDQVDAYKNDGMEEEKACAEAVRQMGDPVETGVKLNQIHKPVFPTGLFLVAVILTITGIIMQAMIFPLVDNAHISQNYLRNTIVYNCIGLIIILAILFLDYTYMIKYATIIYVIYLLMIPFSSFIIARYMNYVSVEYYQACIYPILYVMFLYKNRDRGVKGILCCYGLTMIMILLQMSNYSGLGALSGGTVESALIILVITGIAIKKGILGKNKAPIYGVAFIPPVVGIGLVIVGLIWGQASGYSLFQDYQVARIQAFFGQLTHSKQYDMGVGYIPSNLFRAVQNFSLWGNYSLPENLPINDMYSTFLLNSIFSWFGIILGIAVILMLLFFSVYSLKKSLAQTNRMGMLLGSVCSVSVLVRTISCILINFGFGIYYTSTIPFLSYGLYACIANAIFVGIILCVYRNSQILDENMPKERRYRLVIQRENELH